MIEQARHFTADFGKRSFRRLVGGTENIAERFLVAWPADIAREKDTDRGGEIVVFFHFSEDSAADNDFLACFAFAAFVLGFLVEGVEAGFVSTPESYCRGWPEQKCSRVSG